MIGNLYGTQPDWWAPLAGWALVAITLFGFFQVIPALLSDKCRKFYLPRLLYGAVASCVWLVATLWSEGGNGIIFRVFSDGPGRLSAFDAVGFALEITLLFGIFFESVSQLYKYLKRPVI